MRDRKTLFIQTMIWKLSPIVFALTALCVSRVNASDGTTTSYLTYHNQPMGTAEKPLVMRTYFPNPDLEPVVTARHGSGEATPRYSAKTGTFAKDYEDQAIQGIPAAFGVNAGPDLSYVWDTTECRLLFAWANGFLDMEPYWGQPDRGSRKSHDYVPRLIGNLFYKARGTHPLQLNGAPLSGDLTYRGQSRPGGQPEFRFQAGDSEITTSIQTGDSPQTLKVTYHSSNAEDELTYLDPETPVEVVEQSPGKLSLLIRPNAAESHTGFQREVIEITEANAEAGSKLYVNFGCMACHTIDGGKGHGPTFKGLYESTRDFPELGTIVADDTYLRESITQPATKSIPGYPIGMMPAYPLNEKQVDSLILFIKEQQ